MIRRDTYSYPNTQRTEHRRTFIPPCLRIISEKKEKFDEPLPPRESCPLHQPAH